MSVLARDTGERRAALCALIDLLFVSVRSSASVSARAGVASWWWWPASPITWVLLFLVFLILFFLGWLYYRRRASRRVHENVLQEIQTVLGAPPREWQHDRGGTSSAPSLFARAAEHGSSVVASEGEAPSTSPLAVSSTIGARPSSSTSHLPAPSLVAPPNSATERMATSPGAADGTTADNGALASVAPTIGLGVLLHQGIAPETASHTVTPAAVSSTTSLEVSPAAPVSAAADLSPSFVRVASPAGVQSLASNLSVSPALSYSPAGQHQDNDGEAISPSHGGAFEVHAYHEPEDEDESSELEGQTDQPQLQAGDPDEDVFRR